MMILLIGSGAREHAIVRALHKSTHTPTVCCFGSSRNPGIVALTDEYEVGSMNDIERMVAFAKDNAVEWAIVGPEIPLAMGVIDALMSVGIPSVGPTKEMAQLESSKGFTRQLARTYQIPGQPIYKKFVNMDGVQDFLYTLGEHYVIKADGLMGGKGVKVSGDHLHSHEEALAYCESLLDAGGAFVIEEKFVGQEFSFISLCDGEHLAHTFAIQDHKRAFVGDVGPNTGGMGTYSDVNHSLPFLNEEDIVQAKAINVATAHALKKTFGYGYTGVLYGGFMATASGVKLIEYNARFGDPEAMNIFTLLESDFVEACLAVINKTLAQDHLKFSPRATVCKYTVPTGYPDAPIKNESIDIADVENPNALFFGAVDERDGTLYETGSRTIAVVGVAETIVDAEKIAEREITHIKGPLFHREDIGTDPLIQKRIAMMKNLRT